MKQKWEERRRIGSVTSYLTTLANGFDFINPRRPKEVCSSYSNKSTEKMHGSVESAEDAMCYMKIW